MSRHVKYTHAVCYEKYCAGSHFGVVDAFEQKEVLEFGVTYKELVAKEVSSFRQVVRNCGEDYDKLFHPLLHILQIKSQFINLFIHIHLLCIKVQSKV